MDPPTFVKSQADKILIHGLEEYEAWREKNIVPRTKAEEKELQNKIRSYEANRKKVLAALKPPGISKNSKFLEISKPNSVGNESEVKPLGVTATKINPAGPKEPRKAKRSDCKAFNKNLVARSQDKREKASQVKILPANSSQRAKVSKRHAFNKALNRINEKVVSGNRGVVVKERLEENSAKIAGNILNLPKIPTKKESRLLSFDPRPKILTPLVPSPPPVVPPPPNTAGPGEDQKKTDSPREIMSISQISTPPNSVSLPVEAPKPPRKDPFASPLDPNASCLEFSRILLTNSAVSTKLREMARGQITLDPPSQVNSPLKTKSAAQVLLSLRNDSNSIKVNSKNDMETDTSSANSTLDDVIVKIFSNEGGLGQGSEENTVESKEILKENAPQAVNIDGPKEVREAGRIPVPEVPSEPMEMEISVEGSNEVAPQANLVPTTRHTLTVVDPRLEKYMREKAAQQNIPYPSTTEEPLPLLPKVRINADGPRVEDPEVIDRLKREYLGRIKWAQEKKGERLGRPGPVPLTYKEARKVPNPDGFRAPHGLVTRGYELAPSKDNEGEKWEIPHPERVPAMASLQVSPPEPPTELPFFRGNNSLSHPEPYRKFNFQYVPPSLRNSVGPSEQKEDPAPFPPKDKGQDGGNYTHHSFFQGLMESEPSAPFQIPPVNPVGKRKRGLKRKASSKKGPGYLAAVLEEETRFREGTTLKGCTKIALDRALDPPLGACFQCWSFDHKRRNCTRQSWQFCTNCGRRDVKIYDCPRCKEAYRRAHPERIPFRERKNYQISQDQNRVGREMDTSYDARTTRLPEFKETRALEVPLPRQPLAEVPMHMATPRMFPQPPPTPAVRQENSKPTPTPRIRQQPVSPKAKRPRIQPGWPYPSEAEFAQLAALDDISKAWMRATIDKRIAAYEEEQKRFSQQQ